MNVRSKIPDRHALLEWKLQVGSRTSIAIWLGAGATAAVVGLLAAKVGVLALVLLAAGLFLTLSFIFPWAAAYAVVVSAFLTMPNFVPSQVPVPGFSMYLFEPFLYMAAFVALLRLPRSHTTDVASGFLVLAITAGGILSLTGGATVTHVVSDVRSLLYFACALFMAGRYASVAKVARVKTLVWVLLWFSAALVLFSSATGIPIGGRQEEGTLYLEGSGVAGEAATRILTGTTNLALPVLAGYLGLWVMGKTRTGSAVRFFLPALIISFLGFSRNTILGVAVAIVFSLVVLGSVQTWRSAVRRLLAVAAACLGLYVALPLLQLLPGANFVATQVDTYASRVIDGLSQQTLSLDTSVLYRERENLFLFQAIGEQPLFGHGFGYAYKPGEGQIGSFWADKGTIYAHNFYLWVMVKSGLVGLGSWLVLLALPITRAFRLREPGTLFLASGAVSLMAVSFVAPMPLGSAGSVAIGAFIGAAIAFPSAATKAATAGIQA